MNRIDMTIEQQLLREKRDSVVMKHVEAENRHDVDAAIATFHAPRYQVMPMGMVHDGEQAVGELLSGMFKGFPDFTVEIIPLTATSWDPTLSDMVLLLFI